MKKQGCGKKYGAIKEVDQYIVNNYAASRTVNAAKRYEVQTKTGTVKRFTKPELL